LNGEFATATIRHADNSSRAMMESSSAETDSLFGKKDIEASRKTIQQWPGYCATPLMSLSGLGKELGVADIFYKDESSRFGLGSFKALGGAYAVHELSRTSEGQVSDITVTSATDGNHGLSVAWGARTAGCRCVIYIHAEVSKHRERALQSMGAEVIRIDGNYDASVRVCAREATSHGRILISDTTFDDEYRDIPTTVMGGYSVLASEIIDQLGPVIPTHVFVQGGVGGLAAAICEATRFAWAAEWPTFVIVEPDLAACLYASAVADERRSVAIHEETVMAGLSCGEVSIVAWEVLHRHASHFLTIPDSLVAPTMRLLADAPYGDPPIVAGESAVAGLAALLGARQQSTLSERLGLSSESRVLIIGTEGATDPQIYESIVGRPAESVLSRQA